MRPPYQRYQDTESSVISARREPSKPMQIARAAANVATCPTFTAAGLPSITLMKSTVAPIEQEPEGQQQRGSELSAAR